jgi:hypothetical protein
MPNVEKRDDIVHEPGVYFGLDENEYHADKALGSTDIRMLAAQPWKWQYDRLRPRTRKMTADMIWGAALHCRVLEGEAVFRERYRQYPHPSEYPGCLVTVDDLKTWLMDRGRPVSKMKKADLIESVKQFIDAPVIFDDVVAEFEKQPRIKVSEDISLDIHQEIEDAVANMNRDPVLSAVMQAGALRGGACEISVFYEVDGIRRKARFDYGLAPTENRPQSLIVDLKSFGSFKGKDYEDAAKRKIFDAGYDVQAVDYSRAHAAAEILVLDGQVFGEEPYEGFAEQFFGYHVDFVWVMVKRDEAMLPVTLTMARNDMHFLNVGASIDRAYENYRFFMSEYGPDKLWTPPPRMPRVLTYADFPSYDRGY